MIPSERWLVISHEATNSGAPRMLLELLRGVRATRGPGWSCEILLRRGGPLQADFARLGPVYLLPHSQAEGSTFRAGVYRKFFDRPWLQPRRLARWIEQKRGAGFNLVYNNTATNGYLVPAARSLGCPVLTHVHELGYAMRRFNTPAALAQTLTNTDLFLAVSSAVAVDLVECGVSPARIVVTPNFLPALPPEFDEAARPALRERLGLPPETWVITGCGHIDWLKGTDIFVETAAALARLTQHRFLLVWIGGETDARFAKKVRRLVQHRNLDHQVRFVGAVPEAGPWFGGSDVVTVTSRFESFSLVALEAGARGRSVVGFSDARGLMDVLGEEPGLLVENFDPSAMASTLHEMLQNPPLAHQRGQRLRARIGAEFLAGPRIAGVLATIDKLVKNWKRSP